MSASQPLNIFVDREGTAHAAQTVTHGGLAVLVRNRAPGFEDTELTEAGAAELAERARLAAAGRTTLQFSVLELPEAPRTYLRPI